MAIRAILFDGDGVVQRPAPYAERLRKAFGALPADSAALYEAIHAAEQPALTGAARLSDLLPPILAAHGLAFDPARFFAGWHGMTPEPAVLALVARLRAAGIWCAIASNQEAIRARFMSRTLGYHALFDREYYSCDLGAAKPDPAFFRILLADGRLDPATTLFIDDRAENVAAAARAGFVAVRFALPDDGGAGDLAALLARFFDMSA